MAYNKTMSEIGKLSKKHRLPPALISWRLNMGFPMTCIGATELEGITYFNRPFTQEPYIDKKSIKTQPSPGVRTPSLPSGPGITYKRSKIPANRLA